MVYYNINQLETIRFLVCNSIHTREGTLYKYPKDRNIHTLWATTFYFLHYKNEIQGEEGVTV